MAPSFSLSFCLGPSRVKHSSLIHLILNWRLHLWLKDWYNSPGHFLQDRASKIILQFFLGFMDLDMVVGEARPISMGQFINMVCPRGTTNRWRPFLHVSNGRHETSEGKQSADDAVGPRQGFPATNSSIQWQRAAEANVGLGFISATN